MHLGEKHASGSQISSLIAFHFSSTYKLSNPTLNKLDFLQIDRYSHLPCNVSLTLDKITEGLNSLCNSESKGPDGIAAVLLYQCRQFLSIPLFILFNESLYREIFPTVWKISSVTPIFKSRDSTDIVN